jgi:hypothetical protein
MNTPSPYLSSAPTRRPLAELLQSRTSISLSRPTTPSIAFSLPPSTSSLDLTLLEPPPHVLTKEQLNAALFRHDPEYTYPPPSPRQPSASATIVARSDPQKSLNFPGHMFQLSNIHLHHATPIRVGSYVFLQSRLHEGHVTIIKT